MMLKISSLIAAVVLARLGPLLPGVADVRSGIVPLKEMAEAAGHKFTEDEAKLFA
jgi:hypothetical protein